VEHINTEISEAVLGLDASEQGFLDKTLIDLDVTTLRSGCARSIPATTPTFATPPLVRAGPPGSRLPGRRSLSASAGSAAPGWPAPPEPRVGRKATQVRWRALWSMRGGNPEQSIWGQSIWLAFSARRPCLRCGRRREWRLSYAQGGERRQLARGRGAAGRARRRHAPF
jgi:hypothetical protein